MYIRDGLNLYFRDFKRYYWFDRDSYIIWYKNIRCKNQLIILNKNMKKSTNILLIEMYFLAYFFQENYKFNNEKLRESKFN